jgi:hypothetical protein
MKILPLAFTTVTTLLFSSIVSASNPTTIAMQITCPSAQTALKKSGNVVSGLGTEQTDNQLPTQVMFQGLLSNNFSGSITSYVNHGADYNAVTAQVICYYINFTNAAFRVSRTLTNGFGGTVIANKSTGITISVPAGF